MLSQLTVKKENQPVKLKKSQESESAEDIAIGASLVFMVLCLTVGDSPR